MRQSLVVGTYSFKVGICPELSSEFFPFDMSPEKVDEILFRHPKLFTLFICRVKSELLPPIRVVAKFSFLPEFDFVKGLDVGAGDGVKSSFGLGIVKGLSLVTAWHTQGCVITSIFQMNSDITGPLEAKFQKVKHVTLLHSA